MSTVVSVALPAPSPPDLRRAADDADTTRKVVGPSTRALTGSRGDRNPRRSGRASATASSAARPRWRRADPGVPLRARRCRLRLSVWRPPPLPPPPSTVGVRGAAGFGRRCLRVGRVRGEEISRCRCFGVCCFRGEAASCAARRTSLKGRQGGGARGDGRIRDWSLAQERGSRGARSSQPTNKSPNSSQQLPRVRVQAPLRLVRDGIRFRTSMSVMPRQDLFEGVGRR